MPSIQKLQITSLRNISQETLRPSGTLNLFYGENGSGKSSILEAIHFLGLGRSFRNTRQTPLIQNGCEACTVFAELDDKVTLGVTRSLNDPPEIHIMGRKAASAAELARHLPLQLLNAEAFKLLEGSPKVRRQFLDWGVFHVEHQYHDCWRQLQKCLQQRNALLKRHASPAELAPWTAEFARLAVAVDEFRGRYLQEYAPCLHGLLQRLITLEGFSMEYARGWSEDESLEDALAVHLDRDMQYGYTTLGPQRADLKIKVGQQYAGNILSRGQQKLLVSAMRLAQGVFLEQVTDNKCLYLVDDLPAELDRRNRRNVCALLCELGGQVFLTGNEKEELAKGLEDTGFDLKQCKLFHVKHGKMEESEIPAR